MPAAPARMGRNAVLGTAALTVALAGTALVAPAVSADGGRSVRVTSSADAGPGTLRAAIEAANATAASATSRIRRQVGTIALLSPVVFTGAAGPRPVRPRDHRRVWHRRRRPSVRRAAVTSSISGLRISGAPDNNIDIEVPASATGTLKVELDGVTIAGSGNHGVFIEDQVLNSAGEHRRWSWTRARRGQRLRRHWARTASG